jgi:catechol 2,3-dioxygenase-like lactoylglutathione lyase family enzyme
MFKALTPNILVADVEETVSFYTHLGFEKIAQVPEHGKPQWAMIKAGEISIMIQDKKSAESDLPFRYTNGQNGGVLLYMDVEDLEKMRTRIVGKALIIKDIHSTFYGTNELIIADPDHYLLIFAEDKK